jgi:hypothetical protein
VRLARYSDHMSLTLLEQNTTNDRIVLGQTNEILVAFYFKDQTVEAVKKPLIFGGLRSYSDATIEVKGLVHQLPGAGDHPAVEEPEGGARALLQVP